MSNYKIYQYISSVPLEEWRVPPYTYNYKNALDIRLHPKRTFIKGELTKVEFYSSYDPGTETFDDLVVQEDYVYIRENGFVSSRELTITWVLADGTLSPNTKTRIKYYDQGAALAEGKRRRKNLINNLSIQIVGLIAATEGVTVEEATATGEAFLDKHSADISTFELSGSDVLPQAIAADTEELWLDNPLPQDPETTIREFIISELTI